MSSHQEVTGNEKNEIKIEKQPPPPIIEIGGEETEETEKINQNNEKEKEEIPEIVDLETIVDIEVATKFKESGNKYFKKREYQDALQHYSYALSSTPVEENIFKSKILANRAACFLKLVI